MIAPGGRKPKKLDPHTLTERTQKNCAFSIVPFYLDCPAGDEISSILGIL